MFPVQVTIRNMPKSSFLEDYLVKKVHKLNHYCQRISTCRIAIDMPQKHKHQGKLFRVSIELVVQGKELVVNRKLNEDIYVAIMQAYDAIERQLEDYMHRRVTSIRRRKRNFADGNGIAKNNAEIISEKQAIYDEWYADDFEYGYDDEVGAVMQDMAGR